MIQPLPSQSQVLVFPDRQAALAGLPPGLAAVVFVSSDESRAGVPGMYLWTGARLYDTLTGTFDAAGEAGQLTLTATATQAALPFPAVLSAADYTLSPTTPPGIDADGTLVFTAANSSQPGAMVRNGRLLEGTSFSATLSVNNPDNMRAGFLLTPDGTLPVTDNGVWIAIEGAGSRAANADRVRVLRWNLSTFNYDNNSSIVKVLAPLPTMVAGNTYALNLDRTGDLLTFSVDGAAYLTYQLTGSYVGEEPVPGVQVSFRSAQRTYRIRPLPTGVQLRPGTVSSAVPDDAEVMVRRAGRAGYGLGTLGTQVLSGSLHDRELLPFYRNGAVLQVAGAGLLVPSGTGVTVTARGAVTPGAVLGLAEPATDAAMPLWDPVTKSNASMTTVDPASRTVTMTPESGGGYAYRSKAYYDPAQDITIEFSATLEQLTGTKAWLGAVFHVNEMPGNYNYAGVNVNRDLTGPTGGNVIAALYGDEAFTNAGAIQVQLGVEYAHRLVYDAATRRILWWMNDAFQVAVPWVARGPVHLWIGSVVQDQTPPVPGNQSRATFRDVRIMGVAYTPLAVPLAPTDFVVTPGDTLNTLTWTPRANTGVDLSATIGNVTTSLTVLGSGFVHSGLTNGTPVAYNLSFINSAGTGPAVSGTGTPVSGSAVLSDAPFWADTASPDRFVVTVTNDSGLTLNDHCVTVTLPAGAAPTTTDLRVLEHGLKGSLDRANDWRYGGIDYNRFFGGLPATVDGTTTTFKTPGRWLPGEARTFALYWGDPAATAKDDKHLSPGIKAASYQQIGRYGPDSEKLPNSSMSLPLIGGSANGAYRSVFGSGDNASLIVRTPDYRVNGDNTVYGFATGSAPVFTQRNHELIANATLTGQTRTGQPGPDWTATYSARYRHKARPSARSDGTAPDSTLKGFDILSVSLVFTCQNGYAPNVADMGLLTLYTNTNNTANSAIGPWYRQDSGAITAAPVSAVPPMGTAVTTGIVGTSGSVFTSGLRVTRLDFVGWGTAAPTNVSWRAFFAQGVNISAQGLSSTKPVPVGAQIFLDYTLVVSTTIGAAAALANTLPAELAEIMDAIGVTL